MVRGVVSYGRGVAMRSNVASNMGELDRGGVVLKTGVCDVTDHYLTACYLHTCTRMNTSTP